MELQIKITTMKASIAIPSDEGSVVQATACTQVRNVKMTLIISLIPSKSRNIFSFRSRLAQPMPAKRLK